MVFKSHMGSIFKSIVRLFTAHLRETVWRCCAFTLLHFSFLKNFFSALIHSPSESFGLSLTLLDLLRRRQSPLLWTCLKPYTSDRILCYVNFFFLISGYFLSVFSTYNDWGEQKWTQSRKREGPGETAPAPCVRPERTFKDWTGLCWDTGVSVGESLKLK